MNSKLITVAQAAKLKGVTRSTIYRAISEGRLDAQTVLEKVALKRQDVERWEPYLEVGRPKGRPVSEETKARISQSQKKRWARIKQSRKS